jgi:hypothetical protein
MSPIRHIGLQGLNPAKLVVNQHFMCDSSEDLHHIFRLFLPVFAGRPTGQSFRVVLLA